MTPADHDALREEPVEVTPAMLEAARRAWNEGGYALLPTAQRMEAAIAAALPLAPLLAKAESAERVAADVKRALSEATRMDAILLMAGEMTAQERRTARAVANGIAARVRAALRTDPPAGTDAPVKEGARHG